MSDAPMTDARLGVLIDAARQFERWGKPWPAFADAMQATVFLEDATALFDPVFPERREGFGALSWRRQAVARFSLAVRQGLICC